MIIEKLINQGFCFSVMKSYSYFTKAKFYKNPEYEILALTEDFESLQDDNFQLNDDWDSTPKEWLNPSGMISRIMRMQDIKEFKKLKDEYFTEVYNSEFGIVYELKSQSFKRLFENIKNN